MRFVALSQKKRPSADDIMSLRRVVTKLQEARWPDKTGFDDHGRDPSGAKPTPYATVAEGGTGATSSEELARPHVFIKYSKSGQPTYLGKSPDADLKPGEAILKVNKKTGDVSVQNTNGLVDSDALAKFGKHAKDNFGPKAN